MDDKNESSAHDVLYEYLFILIDWRETLLLLLDDFLCDEKVFALRKRACHVGKYEYAYSLLSSDSFSHPQVKCQNSFLDLGIFFCIFWIRVTVIISYR